MGAEFDTSELRAFASDVMRGAERLPSEARQVVSRGALSIKKRLQSEARASKHFKGFAGSISYDLLGNGSFSEAQIGPVKGGPGSLANIAYFGTSRGGGTVPDPRVALEAEVPEFERYLGEVAEGLI